MNMKKYIALILALALPLGLAACGKSGKENPKGYQLAAPGEPAKGEVPEIFSGDVNALLPYLQKSIPAFLGTAPGENMICSPVNLYLALAMLTECTDGNSRAQLLELLGAEDLAELRQTAKELYETHYKKEENLTSLLGASLWIKEGYDFNQETLALLAEHYYASAFAGDPTDQSFFESFKNWLNQQTNGLLKDQIDSLSPFTADTVLTLATTVYFKGEWSEHFVKDVTYTDVFHGLNGDLQADYMRQSIRGTYYAGDGFTAVRLSMKDGAGMWVLLPDEGVSAEALLANGKAAAFVLDENKSGERARISVTLPKFDVNSSLVLNANLQQLGVTDVFTPFVANFKPLTATGDLVVSKVQHDARVKIDEDGCEAAAYTIIEVMETTALEERFEDFFVDRPFVFIIEEGDGLPLFIGTVNIPQ